MKALLHITTDYTSLNTALAPIFGLLIETLSNICSACHGEGELCLPFLSVGVSQHSLLIRECSFWFHDRFDNQGC